MAEVFRATVGPDPDVHSFDFAVKRLHEEYLGDRRLRDMFLAEAYLSKLMVHPNIVRAFESGEIEGRPYIALEHLRGTGLAELLDALFARKLRVPPDIAVNIALHALRAIDYIHQAKAPGGKPMGIVHRDITPSNIHISLDGTTKLTDFGVARVNLLEPREDADLLKGKAAYIAPEAIINGTVTQAGDIWALGACLFEMLAGRHLYEGMTEQQILNGADAFKTPSASDYGTAVIDKGLSKIVSRLLHPNPKRRPDSAAEAYRLLNTQVRESGQAVETNTVARFVAGTLGNLPQYHEQPEPPTRDPLSGNNTFQRTMELMRIELDRSKRYGRTFSLLFLDLDDFNAINEEVGPEVGDAIIRHIGQVVLPQRAGLRSSDVLGRRGEDRFLVILPETSAEGARITAERLRTTFAATEWKLVNENIVRPPTVSIGVANYPDHGKTTGALVEAAEVACYQAKEAGKDAVTVASSELDHLKARLNDGTATDEDLLRWQELTELYRKICEPSDLDRRRFERQDISVSVVVELGTQEYNLTTSDFSTGGLRLALPVEPEGDELHIKLLLPDQDPVSIRAKVAWRRRDGMTGIEFIELPTDARDAIEHLLSPQGPRLQ